MRSRGLQSTSRNSRTVHSSFLWSIRLLHQLSYRCRKSKSSVSVANLRPLPDQLIQRLLTIADAIHSRGVFHRDFSIRNFLVNLDESNGIRDLRLIDFTYAYLTKPDVTKRILRTMRGRDIGELESEMRDLDFIGEGFLNSTCDEIPLFLHL